MVWTTLARHFFSRPTAPVDPALVAQVAAVEQHLGRSLAIRHVAAGSCNGCELELRATQNLIYDLTQYGLSFTPSPRHADILLITGVAGRNMLEAVRQTRAAMPDPVFVVAVGDCAVDGGVFKGSYAVLGGVTQTVPVDLLVRGCPPTPLQVLAALTALVEVHTGRGGQLLLT